MKDLSASQPCPPDPGPGEDQCRKKNPVIRFIRLVGGWILVCLGIVGLFLPILQGVLMIAAGVALLSGESEFIRRLLRRAAPYYRLMRQKWNAWRAKRKKN